MSIQILCTRANENWQIKNGFLFVYLIVQVRMPCLSNCINLKKVTVKLTHHNLSALK